MKLSAADQARVDAGQPIGNFDPEVPYALDAGLRALDNTQRRMVPRADRVRRTRLNVSAAWYGELPDLPALPEVPELVQRLYGRFVLWTLLVDKLMLTDERLQDLMQSLIWDTRDEMKAALDSRLAELATPAREAAATGYAFRY